MNENIIHLKGVIMEDFVNYAKPSIFLITCQCDWKCCHEANIPISVCGEMAGRQDSIMVLAGMGIRNLSMSPKLISATKELLSRFTIKELQAISDQHLDNMWEMNI